MPTSGRRRSSDVHQPTGPKSRSGKLMHAPNPPWARRTLIGLSRRGPQVNQNLQPRAFHRGIPSRSAGHGMTRAQPPPAAHQHNIFFSPRNPLCPNHLPRQHPPAASLNPPTPVVTWNQGGQPSLVAGVANGPVLARFSAFWPHNSFIINKRIRPSGPELARSLKLGSRWTNQKSPPPPRRPRPRTPPRPTPRFSGLRYLVTKPVRERSTSP